MFGKNEVASAAKLLNADGDLLVNSIFYTIQGEGPDAGRPAVFVRLAKCNLRCYFCDTEFETGTLFSAQDVYDKIKSLIKLNTCKLVVFTGGEPLLQNLWPLVRSLNCDGINVSIETAGTVYSDLNLMVVAARMNKVVCSPKAPQVNRDLVPYVSAWKYIVAVGQVSGTDGLPNVSTQMPGVPSPIYRPETWRAVPIYIQPMEEYLDGAPNYAKNRQNAELAACICMTYGYRLSLQMHKLVGVP